jgi:hypothetical protein
MKTAVIPQVRVHPQLRDALEAVLHEGENLSAFVEAALQRAVEFRQVEARFHARGQLAWEQVQAGQPTLAADAVLDGLRAKLAARREELTATPRPRAR